VLKLHPRLAPSKAAVFPLVKKDGMPEKALEIYRALKQRARRILRLNLGRDKVKGLSLLFELLE
jgi:glycyl-tRNA synthetase (class II)